MTNFILYDKINSMKIRLIKKTKLLIFFLLCTALFCIACAHFCDFKLNAFAEQSNISVSEFLPQSHLESYALQTPIDVYYQNGTTAITQNNQQLLIYSNNTWQTPVSGFNAINQVKKLNDNKLLVSDDGTVYELDIEQPLQKNALISTTDNVVGGSFFDINDNHLVTAYSNTGTIYEITADGYEKIANFVTSTISPVAINSAGDIFFVNGDGLARYDLSSRTYSLFITGDKPTQIIANEQFLYYILDEDIYRVAINGGEKIKLSISDIDKDYDLGTIENPTGISFKDENLLIIDGNTIQEYCVINNQLVFTGFAIANNYTAYNRVSSTATLIEKTSDSVAVLDDFKFTVFTNKTKNVYDRENYVNVLNDKIINSGVMPTNFAFDGDNAIFLYNSGTANCFIKKLEISTQEMNDFDNQTENKKVRAITYQSGRFYLLVDIGNDNSKIYSTLSSNTAITENDLLFESTHSNSYNQIAVDVYGNVILSTNTSLSLFDKQNGYAKAWDKTGLTNITKIQTDLLGRVFVLDNGAVRYITSEQIKTYSLQAVKNFALDFVNSKVFLLFNNSEFINYTTNIDNLSFDDLIIPSEFTFTNPAGVSNAKESLQFFTLKQGANAYKVENTFVIGENFVFDNLTNYSGEYVLICTVDCFDLAEFYVLANQTDIVLIEKTQAQEKQINIITNLPQKAFVATDVNAYYLPIITANDSFAMNNGVDIIRVEKLIEIAPKHRLNFLGYDYYYAEFTANGTKQCAYIPCDYTVEVLTEDLIFNKYRLERVKATAIYADETMTTELARLSEDSSVRIISQSGEICKIAYKTPSGEYTIGYIYADKIIDEPGLAIRNILIIVIIVACVCATSIFFIVRKKKHD